jgi:tRNA modification GTPase
VHCDPLGRFEPEGVRVGAPVIHVRTKSDLPRRGGGEGIPVCALDGHNVGTLRRAIADQACSARGAGLSALVPRHRRAIMAALVELREARAACEFVGSGFPNPEVVAAGLRAALDRVGELVGRISPDDVIGRVFATFCVGK